MSDRQRVDVWLFRVRLCKTRAAAARLVAEGGVRLVRDGASRGLDKASATVAVGDTLVLNAAGSMHTYRVLALPSRRGPAWEARGAFDMSV